MNSNDSLLKNIILSIAAVAGIIIFCMVFLTIITKHNRYTEAPDFGGMSYNEARHAARKAKVKVNVTDSVYVNEIGRGEVYSQVPLPGAQVKVGRTIDLTINAVCAKKVKMPYLVGVSLQQAKAELQSKGLVLGKLIYRTDIATNVVLRQLQHGKDVKEGTTIPAGSVVDLVLGLNYEYANTVTRVPDIVGLQQYKAIDILKDSYLNVSSIVYDATINTRADSLSAVVKRQEPRASDNPVKLGSSVKLFLTSAKN